MAIVSEKYLPVVVGVAVVGDHVLRLLFSDGTVGDVDFSVQRWTGVLAPLSDPAYFAQVAVDAEHNLLHAVPRLTAALVHADPQAPAGADHHAVLAPHR